MKKLNIGVLGLGTVGTSVIKIIEQNYEQFKKLMGYDIQISHIYVRNINKPRAIDVTKYHLTNDINDLLNDDLHIVIEVMGGITDTYEYMAHFLKNGTHIITANKDMLAMHLESLEGLAARHGVSLKYEASVAGGIPIVNAINNGLNSNSIMHFMGIFNGTSNFILSQMTHKEMSFDEALALATAEGFAESNPSADVDGIDAQRKVVITCYLAFNQFIKLQDCRLKGIRNVTLEDIKIANALGYRIKLIGQASFNGSVVNASVEPTCILDTHQLAHVENEYNAIYIDGSAVGDTMYYGRGAGGMATGSAVVSDLMHVIRHFDTLLHTLPAHLEGFQSNTKLREKKYIVIGNELTSPTVQYGTRFGKIVTEHDIHNYSEDYYKIYGIEGEVQ